MKQIIKQLILFIIGGAIYILIELLYRGRTHWSMFVLGGICFIYAGIQNEYETWDKPLVIQAIKAAVFITAAEFITGCIVNLWLGWGVWDYSNTPCNILGQVCLLFSILWVFLGTVAIVVDDYLRYWLFNEEKPHYKLWYKEGERK